MSGPPSRLASQINLQPRRFNWITFLVHLCWSPYCRPPILRVPTPGPLLCSLPSPILAPLAVVFSVLVPLRGRSFLVVPRAVLEVLSQTFPRYSPRMLMTDVVGTYSESERLLGGICSSFIRDHHVASFLTRHLVSLLQGNQRLF